MRCWKRDFQAFDARDKGIIYLKQIAKALHRKVGLALVLLSKGFLKGIQFVEEEKNQYIDAIVNDGQQQQQQHHATLIRRPSFLSY